MKFIVEHGHPEFYQLLRKDSQGIQQATGTRESFLKLQQLVMLMENVINTSACKNLTMTKHLILPTANIIQLSF